MCSLSARTRSPTFDFGVISGLYKLLPSILPSDAKCPCFAFTSGNNSSQGIGRTMKTQDKILLKDDNQSRKNCSIFAFFL